MAKLRMTYKNLKALRKSKEYQALLVDLVASNIVPKSTAEGLLGYNIPANLIGGEESTTDDPVVTPDDDNEQGSGSGAEGSGEQGSTNKVTLVYFDAAANDNAGEWKTAEYDLTDDPTGTGILTFAKDAFNDDTINSIAIAAEHTEEGTSLLAKYTALDPQPGSLESGMLIIAYHEADPNAVL